jgi:hypothetical protein
LNYGPYGEQNRNANVGDTVFAEQKTGLMPEWTWTEGKAGDIGVSLLTAFQTKGEAGRKAREALKEEVGPEEFKRMDNIHRNGEKMLKELQTKGILEIRCP